MRKINNYTVYKRSHQLTLSIYQASQHFPKEELYALTSQIRRAAYSVLMNLKEGGVGSELEFFRYVRIALGSCEELEYQLLLAKDLKYITTDQWIHLNNEVVEISKMLIGLLTKKDS